MPEYEFFSHKRCEAFPCHNVAAENFNCLFCFCPLYRLECPGAFKTMANGVKDCSDCAYPHKKDNYKHIIKILMEAKND
jgi:Zn-finger protein